MDWTFHLITIGVILEAITSYWAAIFLFRLYRQKRLQIILIWSASFLFLGSGVVLVLIGVAYPMLFSPNENVSMFFFRTGMSSLILMVFFSEIFMIYIEYGAMKSRIPLAAFAGTLTGLFMGSVLSPSMFWLKRFDTPQVDFISLRFPVLLIGGLILLCFALLWLKVFGRMVRENKNTGLRKKLQYILWGFLSNALGLLVTQAWGIFSNILIINFIYPYLGTISLLILIKGLKLNPKFLIYLKQKVYRLIVFQRGGEVLYIYRFRAWPAKEEHYVVSSLVGVGSFLQSTLGLTSEGIFDTIDVEDTKIICEFKEHLGFALVISEDSPILRQTLHHIVAKLPGSQLLDQQLKYTIPEFEKNALSTLNVIVEDEFFFYPEKE